MWIYENKEWPYFTWDKDKLSLDLAKIRHKQGLILGKMQSLGFSLQSEANITMITHDIVQSFAIEGESLNAKEVRSSIARSFGVDLGGTFSSHRNIDGIVEMMLDATQNYKKALTQKKLFAWHAALFPTGKSGMYDITVGNLRKDTTGPMQVVSGKFGKETVHFEAPQAKELKDQINLFLNWFNKNQSMDPVIKAGIAHFWFVTLHPFDDGNGRIGRAVADMALARADDSALRFYSLSWQIEKDRTDYYKMLERQQRENLNITLWLEWFLGCLGRAIDNAELILSKIIFKSQLWQKINQSPVNERQTLIINKMLDAEFKGFMNTSKYAKITKCSTDTALRDIQFLVSRNILIQNSSGGRSTSYRLIQKVTKGNRSDEIQ